MLVLTRRIGEEILIDGGIRVTVLEVSGSRVRLGIAAPASVGVHRSEIAPADSTSVKSVDVKGTNSNVQGLSRS